MGESFSVRRETDLPYSGERITDLTQLHPIERRFVNQFPNNIDLQALHVGMSTGLIARECSTAYQIGVSANSPVDGGDTMLEYSELLDCLYEVPEILQGTKANNLNREGLWGVFYDGMRSFNSTLSDKKFKELTHRVRANHLNFTLYGRGAIGLSGLDELRTHAHQVRTVSEWLTATYLGADDIDVMTERAQSLDKKTIKNFTDGLYWQHGRGLSALPDNMLFEPDNASICYNMKQLHLQLMQD